MDLVTGELVKGGPGQNWNWSKADLVKGGPGQMWNWSKKEVVLPPSSGGDERGDATVAWRDPESRDMSHVTPSHLTACDQERI